MNFNNIAELEKTGFAGFHTIDSLMRNKCELIPTQQGVYMVLNPERIKLLSKTSSGPSHHKDRPLTYPMDKLEESWIEDTIVLYIGKTGETLRKRIKTYMNFGRGCKVPHRGGRSIWQLENSKDLQICYQVLTERKPANVETEFLEKFKSVYGKLPFANKRN